MYRTKVRLKLASGQSAQSVGQDFLKRFPTAGFEVRTRDEPSPGADRFVQRMGDFLTLVGLAALVIAGIGIGGGVASYLDARRTSIATLKILGATSGYIAGIYALEIGVAAVIGSVAGTGGGDRVDAVARTCAARPAAGCGRDRDRAQGHCTCARLRIAGGAGLRRPTPAARAAASRRWR